MPQTLHDAALVLIGVFLTLLAQAAIVQHAARRFLGGK